VKEAHPRLLPGEDINSGLVDDARHFMSVYTELLSFQELALSQAGSISDSLNTGPSAAAGEAHLAQLRAERDRLRERLDFWTGRYKQLSGEGE
jgi:hypothetical protein